MEEGQGLNLDKALEIAENCEKVDTQLAAMATEGPGVKGKEEDSANVNRIEDNKKGPGKNLQLTCYRRGRPGHLGKDPNCPARGQSCRNCGLEGHFQERCKTKHKREGGKGKTKRHRYPKGGSANMVDTQDDEDDSEYAFTVGDKKQEKIEVIIGGCKLSMIIDSGASTNIIDKQTWEWLKRNKVKCKSTHSDKKLFAYASQTPLDVLGTFSCEVSAGRNTANAEFCVINGKGDPLLGRDTATSLGVLKIGIDVAAVNTSLQTIGEVLQKKNWKTELNIYLAAYRTLPHPTTGVSPGELLFGRKIRTKLPELSDVHVEQGVCDRDGEQKSKSKSYADSRRGARPSEVLPGDQVLVQQEKRDKLSTWFNPTPYTVVSKHGDSLIVQPQQGAQYSRNTAHVKKLRHQACRKEQCQKQVKKRRNRFNSRVCRRNQMWLRPKFQLKDTQLPNQRFHSGDRIMFTIAPFVFLSKKGRDVVY